MHNEDIVMPEPDSFKWLVISTNGSVGAKIFSDLRGASKYMNISESTIRRRIKDKGRTFKIDSFIISQCPYYVSKRNRI